MRKIIIIGMTMASILFASDSVSIPLDSLPADLKAKYETQKTIEQVQETSQKLQSVAMNAEAIGKSVGSAMREGLGALTEEANKFADTKVGMFTAVLIGWKVMGKDAMNLMG